MTRRVFVMLMVVCHPLVSTRADEPVVQPLKIVSPKPMDIIATGINGRGDVIGFEWADDPEHEGVIMQKPFLARGKQMTYLPLLKGYTATFPAGLSDDGAVVGRVSKPAPPGVKVHLRNQAFLWDAKDGIRGLGTLPDDSASIASGISRDGDRISGYAVGANRVRACVWEKAPDGSWTPTALPHQDRLASNTVPISPNGMHVAGTDGAATCLWTRREEGGWGREVIAENNAFLPRAVNDAGMVVGIRFGDGGAPRAVVWTRKGGVELLREPEGFTRSEANALNAKGQVVGMVDGPSGSEVGPNAFVYEQGKMRIITEGGPEFTAASAINDRGEVAGVYEERENKEKPSKP